MDPKLIAEALLTQISMPPNCSTVVATADATASGSRISPDDRQCLAAGFLEFLGGREHRAWQLWMRLGGLGDQGNVGAVARGPLGDRKADTATGARDEHGLAVE